MTALLTFFAIRQDYVWFVAILLWAITFALHYRTGRSPEHRWIVGAALTAIGVGITEWTMLAQAVKPEYPVPPHLIGDMIIGGFWTVQLIVWLFLLRQEWWIRIGSSALLVSAALGRWSFPTEGSAGIAGMTVLLAVVWWRRTSCGMSRISQGLITLAAGLAPFDVLVGQQRRWTEVNQISATVALVMTAAAVFALIAQVRILRTKWPRTMADSFGKELDWLIRCAAGWLVAGFGLAVVSGWSAKRIFEDSVLARASTAAAMVDMDVLAWLLGPEMRLDRHEAYIRPTGRVTEFAHVDHHASVLSSSVRSVLNEIRSHSSDVMEAFIATLRDGKLVLCLNPPHRPEDDLTYVTLQRSATAEDYRDWEEQRSRFEVRLDTSYNEVAIARAPLVNAEGEMFGWLELDLPASFWIAPQAMAHLQAMFAVVLGLGVLGGWGMQRWRAHERESARQEAAVAREADAMKSMFVAKVSHELRTPLQAILGYGDLLRSSVLESDQRKHLEAILNQGYMLARLVDDLIDLGAIETGTVRLQLQPVAMPALVVEAAESLRAHAHRKRLDFSVDASAGETIWVWADPFRVRQVLLNLLGNAIKFTPVGRVEVRVEGTPDGDRYSLRVVVTDTGPGIPAAEQTRLFRPFTRLPGSEHVEGAGLGLAIAAELCRQMDGEIGVTSQPGYGAAFHAKLVLAVANPPAAEREGVPLQLARLSSHRVLIVDDNPFVRELFREYLAGLQMSCDVAADGLTAVRQAEEVGYTAVVLDLMMPGLSGETAARRIRDHGLSRNARVIAASARAVPLDARSDVFDTYLCKPISLTSLARAIAPDVVSAEGQQRQRVAPAELMQKFRHRFRTEAEAAWTALRTAVDKREWDAVHMIAHYTKNSADVLEDFELARRLGLLALAAERRDLDLLEMGWAQSQPALRAWFASAGSPASHSPDHRSDERTAN